MLHTVLTTAPARIWPQLENMADSGHSAAAGILGIKALERAEQAGPLSRWMGADTSGFMQAYENLRRYEESGGAVDIGGFLDRARDALPESVRSGIEARVGEWAQHHGAAPAPIPATEPETTPESAPEITPESPVIADAGAIGGGVEAQAAAPEEEFAPEETPALPEEDIAAFEEDGATMLDEITVSGSAEPDTEYAVQKGDNLSAIARKHYGIERGDFETRAEFETATQNAVYRIAEANGHMRHPNGKIYDMMQGPNANHIFPGQSLSLPPKEDAMEPVGQSELKGFWDGVAKGGKIEFSSHTASFNMATGTIPTPAPRDSVPANVPVPTTAPRDALEM